MAAVTFAWADALKESSGNQGTDKTAIIGASYTLDGKFVAGKGGVQQGDMPDKGVKLRSNQGPVVFKVNEGFKITGFKFWGCGNTTTALEIESVSVDGGANLLSASVSLPAKGETTSGIIDLSDIAAEDNITLTFKEGTSAQFVGTWEITYEQTKVIVQEITGVTVNGTAISDDQLAELKSDKVLTIDGSSFNGAGTVAVTLSSGATNVTKSFENTTAVYTFTVAGQEYKIYVRGLAKTYELKGVPVAYSADGAKAEGADTKSVTMNGITFTMTDESKTFQYGNGKVTLGEVAYAPLKLSTGCAVNVTFPEGKKATKVIVYGWSGNGDGKLTAIKESAESENSVDPSNDIFYATNTAEDLYPSVYEYALDNWESFYFSAMGSASQPFVVMDFVFAGESATKTIYFDPGVWAESNETASYAAWAWVTDGEGAWYAYNSEEKAFTIPEDCGNIIFARCNPEMNPDFNTQNSVWNRTDDIKLGEKNLFTITGWKGADGSTYSTYSASNWPPDFYKVNVAEGIQNGQVSVTPNSAEEGSTVTVTATPDEGYVLDAITVTCDNSNQAVQVAEDGTFTMPADNVTVNATFKEPSIVTTKTLYLKPGVWSTDNARFAARILDRQNPENNSWADFVPVTDAEGYYQAEIPEDASMVRMYRFNPQTTENSEDAGKFWNRTDVISLNANVNLYKITAWPEAEGGNCAYEEATYPEQGGGDEPNDYTVQFVNGANWETVFAYTWTGEGNEEVKQLGPWAGTEMGLINEKATIDGKEYPVYELKFQHAVSPANIIFSDGKGGEVGKTQTENLLFENNKRYQLIIKDEPTPQPTGETSTTTFDFTSSKFISGLGLAVPEESKTTYISEAVTSDNVTLTPIKCSSNWPAIYNSNGALSFRIYKLANSIKGGAQFSVSDGTVDKIVITGDTQLQNVTADNGTIEMSKDNKTLTWTKADGESPASVTFLHGGSKTLSINTIEVTKTIAGGGDTPEPSLVSKVQICGATDAKWENRIDFVLNSAAPEQPNVYYNTLDATDYTDDVEFQLVINDEIWRGIGQITLLDNDGLVDVTTNANGSKNFILKNSNLKYKTYNFKALWKGKEDAGSNWELEVFGQDLRSETPQPAEPVFIVVGQPQTVFGGTKVWDTENDAHKLEEKSGKYYCTFTNVAPQEQNIVLKVYNMANDKWFGKTVEGGENIVFNMKETGDFTVVLDVNADFTEGYVWVDGDNVVFPETPDPQPTETTSTYVFTSNDWKATLNGEEANWTSGKDGAGYNNNGVQVTTNSTGANATSPKSFDNITKIVVTYNTNKTAGNGTLDVKIGDNEKTTKEWAYSNTAADGRTANFTVEYDYETPQSGAVTLTANTTTNSIYVVSVAITHAGGGDEPAVDTYGIVGDLTGGWEKDLMMTVSPNDANIYTATVEGVEIAEFKIYEYKLRANKSWQGYQIPTEGNLTWKPEAVGVYTFTFTANRPH